MAQAGGSIRFGHRPNATPRIHPPHIFKNSASLMIFTPSFCALSNLEPASSPASTKSVFLLTLPVTLPPSASIFAVVLPAFLFPFLQFAPGFFPAQQKFLFLAPAAGPLAAKCLNLRCGFL